MSVMTGPARPVVIMLKPTLGNYEKNRRHRLLRLSRLAEYKMNLREILLALGGQQEGDFIKFSSGSALMDIYPRILIDDGMGYGVDENVIVSVDIDPQNEYINIFRERKPTDEEQAELARQEDSHMSLDKLEAYIKALEINDPNKDKQT